MNTLYKKDTKGRLRMLDISTDGASIVQVSGLLDGKATHNVSLCEGKNIGKSNETSPEQQAEIICNPSLSFAIIFDKYFFFISQFF